MYIYENLLKMSGFLEREFQYFLDHQAELVKQFNGMYLVIVGSNVEGAFESPEAAYQFAINRFALGSFLIQYCSAGIEAYSESHHLHFINA